jgi:mannose-6-phosphate isomerase-like protein (cupin superfamily)
MSEGLAKETELRFARLMAEARGFGLEVREMDSTRPWGGYIRFARASLSGFLSAYWQGVHVRHADLDLDAKLLLVMPGKRLSLQSHAKRSELWRVLEGPVIVSLGKSEKDIKEQLVRPIELVTIPCGRLHRLAAPVTGWGVIAEFWQHEDPRDPSNEKDIFRYADDYGRPTDSGVNDLS